MGFGSFSNIYLNSKMSKLRPAGTDDQITLSNIHQVNLKHPTYLFGPEWRKGGVSPIFTKTQKMSKPLKRLRASIDDSYRELIMKV